MKKRIVFPLPVVVEGKYDKMKLTEVIDGHIITTDGFGIFNKKEKLSLIKRLAERGVVLLCDSDGAGGVIRRHIMSAVPKDKIYNLYIPKIKGKEKRKREGSKEGTLGVEGVDADIIRSIFETFLKNHTVEPRSGEKVTKTDLFTLGLSGSEGSSERRDRIAEKLGLPSGLTAPAFLSAVNVIMTREEFLLLVQSTEEQ